MNNTFSSLLSGAKKIFQKKFLYDVLKTFIGVFLAFWVSEWKTAKQSTFTEKTVLFEIRSELVLDIKDMEENLRGHQKGQQAAKYFWKALHGQPIAEDSLFLAYNELLRNFISVQHSAAYESVKSRGLEIVKDDSLRTQIVNLFDFDLEIIDKLEEKYAPHDFFKFYFDKMNDKFSPFIQINEKGQWAFARPLREMPEKDKQLVKIWLARLSIDRRVLAGQYSETVGKMKLLQKNIDEYLEK